MNVATEIGKSRENVTNLKSSLTHVLLRRIHMTNVYKKCVEGTSLKRRLNKVKTSPAGPPLRQREMKLTIQLNMLNVNTSTRQPNCQ